MCVLLISCQGERQEGPDAFIDEYFNVRALLAENLEQLLRREVVVMEKIASFSGEVEKTTVRLDSLGLAEEFDVFTELDINKPEFSERYIESREEADGQVVIIYEADDKESLNVNYLKVYKDTSSGQVSQIEALFSNKNVLYNSTRLLNLYFGMVEGEHLPLGYIIEGNQKMIFSDPEKYSIQADFVYPN